MTEHHREKPDDPACARFILERHDEAGEVDLGLLAWRGLEADLEGLWSVRRADRRNEALHGGVGAGVAELADFTGQSGRGEIREGAEPLSEVVEKGCQLVRPADLAWSVGRQLQAALDVSAHGLRIAPDAARDRDHGQALAVKVQDHDELSKLDHCRRPHPEHPEGMAGIGKRARAFEASLVSPGYEPAREFSLPTSAEFSAPGDNSAHLGQEVVVHYRWHPLYRQRVRRQYGERRATGEVVHVEAGSGVVTVVAAWMLDPAACAGMAIGAPRVSLAALIDLHQLLIAQGFRPSSADDATVVPEEHDEAVTTEAAPGAAPAEHGTRSRQAPRAEPDRARQGFGAAGPPAAGGRTARGNGETASSASGTGSASGTMRTGMKPAIAPARACLRHVYSSRVLIPCRRATRLVITPGASVSLTICSFCSARQRRRRSARTVTSIRSFSVLERGSYELSSTGRSRPACHPHRQQSPRSRPAMKCAVQLTLTLLRRGVPVDPPTSSQEM